MSEAREIEVLERVRAIPEGLVATYGDVSPGAPRFAGTVLSGNHDPDLPWWRIVRADGLFLTPPTYFISPEELSEYQNRIIDAFGPGA